MSDRMAHMNAQVGHHHDPGSPHWADRVTVKRQGEWYAFRIDDPNDEAIEPISLDQLCFHVLECGAA